jgi:hypothetical protein
MTQIQKTPEKQKSKRDDSLDRVRASAQELHRAITDATAKCGDAMKETMESILPKAKAVTGSVKELLALESGEVKKHLAEAVSHLEAMQKHVAESLKTKGNELQASVRHAVLDAHAAVQKVSDALAAKRTAESTHAHS